MVIASTARHPGNADADTHIFGRPGSAFQVHGPALGKRMLGRTEELARVAELLQECRFVTSDPADGKGHAASLLRQSMAVADRQGAPAWTLRGASTLAAMYQSLGAQGEARAIFEPVLARFREGHETGDLRSAQALMASL